MSFNPRCPMCRKPVKWRDNPHRPFCSERCRLLDLGAWIDGRYRLPGEPVSDDQLSGEGGQEAENAEGTEDL